MKKERWRPVVGYEGLYEVSDHGRVKSLSRIICQQKTWGTHERLMPERILKVSYSLGGRSGYQQVSLHGGIVRRCARVHRLVAEAFISPSPFEGASVLHSDDNTDNCHYKNLRWGTTADNMADKVKRSRQQRGSDVHCSVLDAATAFEVYRLRHAGEAVKRLMERFNISDGTVRDIQHGRTWRHVTGHRSANK